MGFVELLIMFQFMRLNEQKVKHKAMCMCFDLS